MFPFDDVIIVFVRFPVVVCSVDQAAPQPDNDANCAANINQCHNETVPSGGIYAGFAGSDAQQRQQWTEFCL